MKKIFVYRLYLALVVVLCMSLCAIIAFTSINSYSNHTKNNSKDTIAEYDELVERYTSVFKAITIQVKEKIEEDLSYEEMNLWLQSKDREFAEAVGKDVFDGFAMTYKGRYAHSWSYGDYTDYNPNTRPWYAQAAQAGGEVTVVAPYVTYLDPSYLQNDQYIEMTVAQKLNDEISFDMDLKIADIGQLLTDTDTEYDGSIILLTDQNGYVLSTNDDSYYCHNIHNADKIIGRKFIRCIDSAAKVENHQHLVKLGTKTYIAYTYSSANGSKVYSLTPFSQFFLHNFLIVIIISFVLILTITLVYIKVKKKYTALEEKDRAFSEVANAAFERQYHINLDNMTCTYVTEDKTFKTDTCISIYNTFYDEIIGEKSKEEFKQFVSPEAIKNYTNEGIRTKTFLTKSPDSDKKAQVFEIGVIVYSNSGHKRASVLVNNITEKETQRQVILKTIAYHYAAAFIGNVNTRRYEAIKIDEQWAKTTDGSMTVSENKLLEAVPVIIEASQKEYINMVRFSSIKDLLEKSPEHSTRIGLTNGHWYILKLIKSLSYDKSGEFVLCVENTDEQISREQTLKTALREAEIATSAKSDFLSRMSHEIRTPLNAIIGLTEIASANADDEKKVKDYLSKIDSSSKILLSIINDVLDMSAIENKKMKIAHLEFNIKHVLNNISTIYSTQCFNKGIDFKTNVDIKHFEVLGDSLRLNQILINLISNAYKFTEKGGSIALNATETAVKDKNIYICFEVSDTGCGMSEDMLSHLFTPFEQESAITAHKTGGSGLGLSIAKNLADIMHGTITAESKLGKGTTFTVNMPFEMCNDFTEEIENEKNVQLTNKTYNFSGHRILLVEDNDMNTLVATALLETVQLTVDHADNGKLAVEMFDKMPKGTYDLILMDVQMPDMDGYEATRLIRNSNHPQAKTIPIYAMTANVFTEDVTEALSNGMNGHLAKPIDTAVLYNTIDKTINK